MNSQLLAGFGFSPHRLFLVFRRGRSSRFQWSMRVDHGYSIGWRIPGGLSRRAGQTSYHFFLYIMLAFMAFGVAGCSDQGDYGRHDPSLVFKNLYQFHRISARQYLGEEQDYDLPLTASEDALRTRAHDMASIRYVGVVAQIIPARNGDGFAHVAATHRGCESRSPAVYSRFVEAAPKGHGRLMKRVLQSVRGTGCIDSTTAVFCCDRAARSQ